MEPFDIQRSNLLFWGWHENFQTKLRNFKAEIPILKNKKNKNSLKIFFLRLEAEFFLSPCYHARHLQQIHWNQIFCKMHGLASNLSIPTRMHLSLINKIHPKFILNLSIFFRFVRYLQQECLWRMDGQGWSNHDDFRFRHGWRMEMEMLNFFYQPLL